ncbi:hypothetical protein CVT25_009037 [Psilocybe cyanescens]|uniref:Uncharacterized protein n=1 Tax=Psilocybe cyanescens TaxID=93625 RepID=A0A409VRT9_PSICY|nr:hypothetical protein CVT25_009037 [Psilocybe cyanescens]
MADSQFVEVPATSSTAPVTSISATLPSNTVQDTPLNKSTPKYYEEEVPDAKRVKALKGWITGTDNDQPSSISLILINPPPTHEEFKINHGHGAFEHVLDEGPEDDPEEEEKDADSEDQDTENEDDDDDDEGEEAEEDFQARAKEVAEGVEVKVKEEDGRLPSLKASVEPNMQSSNHTRGQIAAYAGVALSMTFRTHFFSMLILGKYAHFIG